MAACVGNHMLGKVWIMDVITYPCWDYPCYNKMSHFRFQYAVKCDMSFVKHHSNWDWHGRALFRFSSVNVWWYINGGRKPCTYVSVMTRWRVDRNVIAYVLFINIGIYVVMFRVPWLVACFTLSHHLPHWCPLRNWTTRNIFNEI